MTLGTAPHSADGERAELETVVAALERSPRLARLLNFVGQKYLDGQTDQITEYNIATEVFGRAKTSFDSTDSVARTEVYRLRKKLKEYYDTEGKDHRIQILIPFRTYAPEFVYRDSLTPKQQSDIEELESIPHADQADSGEVQDSATAERAEPTAPVGSQIVRKRTLLYVGAAVAALVLIGFGAVRLLNQNHPTDSPTSASSGSTGASPAATPSNAASVPLRLLAGYSGSPKIDSAGAYWEADRYFTGSAGFERPKTPMARTVDSMLFDHWRTGGEFSYDIPLAPGFYELHLFFVASPPDDETQYFNVTANGQPLLTAFNISADALGPNIADEKVFKDISPDKDGYLHLRFPTGRTTPLLNALEILPGLPHRQLPVRLVMQAAAVTDHNGNLWHPDDYFQNGVVSDPPRQVSGTPDPKLYAQERYGHFTYSIPVDARSRYTLVLHFAELYWIPDPSGKIGPGSRVFRVYCNGTTLLDNFDIFKEVGSLHALTKTFNHVRPTPEGKLDLTFDPLVNYATISAIEVIDESQ
jgi:hypothetical protein